MRSFGLLVFTVDTECGLVEVLRGICFVNTLYLKGSLQKTKTSCSVNRLPDSCEKHGTKRGI